MKYTLVLCSVIASISGSYAADSTPENALSDSSAADDYIFEPELFRGGRFSQSALAQLVKKNSIAPGKYRVDVSVNSHFVDNIEVEFIKLNDDSVSPCLPETFFKSAGIKLTPPTAANSSSAPRCYFLKQVVKGGSVDMNVAQLRLNLSIPQTEMDRAPRGYVDPEELDSGTSVGFVNYISNYYHVSYSGKNSGNQDSAWASLSGGINLGKWQYRQLSNLNWSRDGGST